MSRQKHIQSLYVSPVFLFFVFFELCVSRGKQRTVKEKAKACLVVWRVCVQACRKMNRQKYIQSLYYSFYFCFLLFELCITGKERKNKEKEKSWSVWWNGGSVYKHARR